MQTFLLCASFEDKIKFQVILSNSANKQQTKSFLPDVEAQEHEDVPGAAPEDGEQQRHQEEAREQDDRNGAQEEGGAIFAPLQKSQNRFDRTKAGLCPAVEEAIYL